MATDIGYIQGVAVGSYGQTILVELIDLDDNTQDVSAYKGNKYAIATSPDKAKTVQAAVSFSTDGSDGLVRWSWASGDINRAGKWEVQIVLNKPGGRVKSYIGIMPAIRQLIDDDDIT